MTWKDLDYARRGCLTPRFAFLAIFYYLLALAALHTAYLVLAGHEKGILRPAKPN